MNQTSVILIGRSGSGKGTQTELLMKYLKAKDPSKNVLYIYAGAEFREFIEGNSETQKLSRNLNENGKLQPEFLALFMWIKILIEKYTGNEHLIFDGTPRRYHEAGVLDSVFGFYGLKKPFVLHMDLSREEAMKRLLARGRMDDTREDIEERLTWYDTQVEPTIDYYRTNPNYTFLTIPAEGSVEDIHKNIIAQMGI